MQPSPWANVSRELMRVVLIGSAEDCARLRSTLASTNIDVVDEALTLALARSSGIEADAYLIAAEEQQPVDEPLTSREMEVLELLAQGLANKAIAQRLAISDQTVKFHVASICGKLGASNRTDAVRRAVRRAIITL